MVKPDSDSAHRKFGTSACAETAPGLLDQHVPATIRQGAEMVQFVIKCVALFQCGPFPTTYEREMKQNTELRLLRSCILHNKCRTLRRRTGYVQGNL